TVGEPTVVPGEEGRVRCRQLQIILVWHRPHTGWRVGLHVPRFDPVDDAVSKPLATCEREQERPVPREYGGAMMATKRLTHRLPAILLKRIPLVRPVKSLKARVQRRQPPI